MTQPILDDTGNVTDILVVRDTGRDQTTAVPPLSAPADNGGHLFRILAEEGEFETEVETASGFNKYKKILTLREVHFLALFAIIYVGVEVTMGGA